MGNFINKWHRARVFAYPVQGFLVSLIAGAIYPDPRSGQIPVFDLSVFCDELLKRLEIDVETAFH